MNIYYLALLISSIFILFKLIQFKLDKSEEKSIKPAIIDGIVVFISVIVGDYLFKMANPILKESAPVVFTNNPTF